MIYLARGPHRTGSTLAYEIMAALGRQAGWTVERFLSVSGIDKRARHEKIFVGRSHVYDFSHPDPKLKVVFTNRCPYARVASALRLPDRFPNIHSFIDAAFTRWKKELVWIRENSHVLCLDYHNGVGTTGVRYWLDRIGNFMSVSARDPGGIVARLSPARLQKISKLPMEETRRRKEMGIWPNHVGKCSEDYRAWDLSEELQDRVRSLFPDHRCVECDHVQAPR